MEILLSPSTGDRSSFPHFLTPASVHREWLPMQLAADKLCALANDTLQATSLQASSATSTTVSATSSSASGLASSAGSANFSTLSSSYSINGTLFPAPTSLGNLSSTITSAPSSTGSSLSTSSAEAAEIPSETLESVIAEASRVITSIW